MPPVSECFLWVPSAASQSSPSRRHDGSRPSAPNQLADRVHRKEVARVYEGHGGDERRRDEESPEGHQHDDDQRWAQAANRRWVGHLPKSMAQLTLHRRLTCPGPS